MSFRSSCLERKEPILKWPDIAVKIEVKDSEALRMMDELFALELWTFFERTLNEILYERSTVNSA